VRRRELVDLWYGCEGGTDVRVDVVLPNGEEFRRCNVLAFGAGLRLSTASGDLQNIDPAWVVSARLVDRCS
jgi:hypothetical protein